MAADLLFHPDNRMLSGFTHDFGLYGGQPDIVVAFAKSPAPAAPAEAAPGGDASSATPSAAPSPLPAQDIPAPAQDAGAPDAAPDVSQPFTPSGEATEPESPDPIGASTPATVLASLQPAAASDGATAPSSPQGPTAAEDATTLIAQQLGAEGLLGSLDADAISLSGLTAAVQGSPVLSSLPLAQAEQVVTSAVTPVADAAAPIAADVAQATASVVQPVASTAADSVESFAGSDPAGGVATLVEMVNSADQFAVADASTADPVASTATSVVDDLIGEEAVPPLLGDTDNDADGTHTDVDDLTGGL